MITHVRVIVPLVSLLACAAARAEATPLAGRETGGRLEASLGDQVAAAWQVKPLADAKGGAKFAGSAFLHPLRTPSGFECTAIQPADHLHHFGLWWPWKFIGVDDVKSNTWEIQELQGAHRAVSAKILDSSPGKTTWELKNQTVTRKPETGDVAVIDETATLSLATRDDAVVLDVSISQKAADRPVTVIDYRYSGFSWRGPLSWNKDNSTMTTSAGKDRDTANGTAARWVMVSGPTPKGSATVLMMSAAEKSAGVQEKLRVWDSKNLNGMPFANFNPVMDKPLPLDDAHPAVSRRKYRVIAADRRIEAAEADAEWNQWTAG